MTSTTSTTTVHTWADAFGVWHAKVAGVDNHGRAASLARDAIRSELAQREAPGWDAAVIGVSLEKRSCIAGDLQLTYVETVRQR